MDERVTRSLNAVTDFKRLAQLEENVRARVPFDEEISAAFQARASTLARDMIAERTGIDLSDLTPAEEAIVRAVSEYLAIKRRQGRDAGYTIRQLKNRGGLIEAAEAAVSQSTVTPGFQTLEDEEREDLSYEQIIIDHPEEFSPRAIWYSRRTRRLPVDGERPPARSTTAVQLRTEELVAWLKVRANANGGDLGNFTNADAARAIGMNDLSSQGRAFGNIQSRLDFACYRAGLPPLGCAAMEPFSNAWGRQERSWGFPVAAMMRAAKEYRWQDHDFARVIDETLRLSGRAYIIWRDELRDHQFAVRDWAEGLETAPRSSDPPEAAPEIEPTPGRNPDWTREEHILGLDLYLRLHGTSYPDEHPEVIKLSETLRALAKLRGMRGSTTFRNPNGVSMKMLNFRRVDPTYEGTGLPSGNKLEVEVWAEYAEARERLADAVETLLYEISMAEAPPENPVIHGEQYWVLVCNPAKWAIDKFLASGTASDTWGVRPFDSPRFAAGQLALVRVGVDRRSLADRDGRPALIPGIYALCEIVGPSFPGTGAGDAYWAEEAGREPGWPTVSVRYLRNYLASPLSIDRLRRERPDLSHLLLNGFQAASFPIAAADFHAVIELLGEDEDSLAGEDLEEEAGTADRLAELESKFLNASPEVKTRISKCIERGAIGREVKRANGFRCQLCEALGLDPIGFAKRNGEPYVEAHHVMPVHRKEIGSLSATNIVTLCANHHREVHYGDVDAAIGDLDFTFAIGGRKVRVPRARVKLRVGILAYGSLINDPGDEIRAATISTVRDVETPFAVEYARSSTGRGGAPTLVPVETGGAKVRAWIYEVGDDEKLACDLLYRREIGQVGGGKVYVRPEPGDTKKVAIDRYVGLGGLHVVVSTRLAATIEPLTPEHLADLAIESARKQRDGRDGISYLMNALASGIATPLSGAYSKEIVGRLGASDLAQAVRLAQGMGAAENGDQN